MVLLTMPCRHFDCGDRARLFLEGLLRCRFADLLWGSVGFSEEATTLDLTAVIPGVIMYTGTCWYTPPVDLQVLQ